MEIRRYELGPLRANCYIIINKDRKAVAIDVGGDAGFLMLEELKHGFQITDILLTHSHFDHIGGVCEFEKRGANVYLSSEDLEGAVNPDYNLASKFGGTFKPFNATNVISGEQTLLINGFSIEVIKTPGHTKGGLTYKIENNLFTGDTLFAGSFGRYDFPGGSIVELVASIKKLFKFSGCNVYSGHGEETTIDVEAKTNPIMYYDNN